jgi:tetrahydromethanopterin S-methyltransferase subunit G
MSTPAIILNSSPKTWDGALVAARAHVDLAGMGLGIGDEFRDRRRRDRRMHQHHGGFAAETRDRHDVADEVEIERLVERRVDEIRRRDQQQRVAVGRRVHHRFGRDVGAGAGAVLDGELLAEPLRQPVACQPRDGVGRAAGGKPDKDVHRPRRIGLRPREA